MLTITKQHLIYIKQTTKLNSMKIFLFRHGQTDYNVKGLNQGMVDIELNENGLEQAKCNAAFLKDFGIQHIYTSPLKRAYLTAKILADKVGADLEILEDLLPLNNGVAEGRPYAFNKEVLGEENYRKFKGWDEEGLDVAFPKGKSRRDVRDRLEKAIDYICKNDKYDVVGVSTHGDNLKELLILYGFDDKSSIKNCEVVEGEYGADGGFRLIRRIVSNNN